ncbi:MAG: prephenate dehydrogenase [Gammaproteobacteria bacterium]
MINRLCIIGVGLIGGSLARALRDAGAVRRIIGCGRGAPNLERAVELGVIDEFEFEPAVAVVDADVVVVATTLSATRGIFAAIAPALAPQSIITDVGSAKCRVIEAARETLGPAFIRFVAGHPIAGTERSGVDASFKELFRDRRVVLTPEAQTDPAAHALIADMWRKTGAEVRDMDAAEHDEVLAATSHLPHVLAYALVECLTQMDESETIFDFAAGGFRDFTRIAASSPAMWSDIVMDNRAALLAMLDRYSLVFEHVRTALQAHDREALLALFERAKAARDRALPPTTE